VLGDCRHLAVEHGVEELLLALEVVVERAALHPGRGEDRVQRRAVVAVGPELLAAGREQTLARRTPALDSSVHHPHIVNRPPV
jgi:hypothetical protein